MRKKSTTVRLSELQRDMVVTSIADKIMLNIEAWEKLGSPDVDEETWEWFTEALGILAQLSLVFRDQMLRILRTRVDEPAAFRRS